MTDADNEPLLSVENLRTHIKTDGRTIHAVDGVDFTVREGETVCIVGETGSGKSVTCKSLTGIIPRPPARIVDGTIEFEGENVYGGGKRHLRSLRGDRIAHIFQNPQQALDPVYSVGDQIIEAITIHRDVDESTARERAMDLLKRVGIPEAETRIDDYPHQFSGGMAQRVAIAIALAADPDLLVADEPTTAVDVTVQARLIELLRELTDGGMALLLITHDFRVVASLADRVLVMFGGTIVERGPTEEVFEHPAHPYTQTLFESYEGLSRRTEHYARGDIPTDGCRFREECPYEVDACGASEQPLFYDVDRDESRESDRGTDEERTHAVSCVHYARDGDPGEILDTALAVSPSRGDDND